MTVAVNNAIHYPSGGGQPVAETFANLYTILMTIEVLHLLLTTISCLQSSLWFFRSLV
jgi:hypothetical protein